MPYITTAQQIGREEGIEMSMPMGYKAVAAILEIKFGEAGQRLSERVYQIKNLETMQKLIDDLKHVKSLSEAEKVFNEAELTLALN